jgi:predicted nucleic acid-binding protein
LNPGDEYHKLAYDYMADSAARFVTTWWVLAEMGNYLAKGRNRKLFAPVVALLRTERNWTIESVAQEQLDRGIDLYRRRPDKAWSVTDCVSFVLMKQRRLADALTADHHFEQAGFRALLKV